MRARCVSVARFVVLVALEVAAIPLLRSSEFGGQASLDWRHLGRWLSTAAPDDAVIAVVRLVAMAVAGWLLVTTTLYFLARLSGVPGLVRGIAWATLPGARRIVDAAVATSIVGGAVLSAAPARAQIPGGRPPVVVELSTTTTAPAGHLYTPVAAGDHGPVATTTALPSSTVSTRSAHRPPPSVTTSTTSTAMAPTKTTPLATPIDRSPGRMHTVVVGDNLWTISVAELSRQTGRAPDHLAEVEVRSYWLGVIEANLDRIRSGDPNLIYPGESILCPPAS